VQTLQPVRATDQPFLVSRKEVEEDSRLREKGGMLAQQDDVHGNVPDNTTIALLLIDVINDLEFDGGGALLAHCLEDGVRGQPLAEQLRPEQDDYFVLKPKHSGFYATTLDLLLRYLHVTTVIHTGLTGDICVLFTANDAYMRDFQLVVPADCVASQDAEENRHALRHMQRILKADIRPSTALDLHVLTRHLEGQK
jgi:nicotinamidase-related amidase